MPTGTTITRQILGNIPALVVILFYTAAVFACGFAILAFVWRIARYPRPDKSLQNRKGFLRGVVDVAAYLTFHKQLLRDRYAGMAHLLMFHGFFILFLGTCLVAAEDYGQKLLHVEHVFFYGRFYLVASLLIDLGGVGFLIGLLMFMRRRLARQEERILRQWWVGALSVLLLLIGVTGFLLEGARIARDLPGFEIWSVIGYATALALRGMGISGEAAAHLHRGLWTIHAALCVGFFALLPWGFFSHMVYGAASWATRSDKPRAQLHTPELSPGTSPGAATWKDLGWHDLLQADACTTCGRCNSVCPAQAAGKPLRPREVVLGLRAAMGNHHSPKPGPPAPGLSAFVPDEMIWSCTTCGACNEACPIGIEVYDKIVELRRGRIEAGVAPAAAVEVFESTAERANPFGKSNADRMLWADGLDTPIAEERQPIELLYWIGCAGSFDSDGQSVSRAMIKILNHLKINYHVLGKKERCTGDPARLMGEEGLFQELARQNIAQFGEHGVRRILTHCPHCFNTFKNEYSTLGGQYEVEHHSQFLARMIRDGRLKLPEAQAGVMTFHDPCYLGRGNGETQAPRNVLFSLPQVQVVEMERHGKESFCCGAGGGSMWLDVKGNTRVENLRAQEAAATGAATIATGCPFCKGMLKAGTQTLAGNAAELSVKDLAELVAEAERL